MKKQTVFKGLAGAAAMAGASQAYGTVIVDTTPANLVGRAPATTDAGTRVNIDVNGDGTRDLSILYRNLIGTNGGYLLLSYLYAGSGTAGSGMFAGATLGTNASYAYNLPAGYSVGSASHMVQSAGYFGHIVTNYQGTDYGYGTTGGIEYIGFEFKPTSTSTTFDYGYIELQTSLYTNAANPGGITFLKLAYDNSGAAITTGAVPEPSSLAALALGAAACGGVALKRRQRAAKA